MNNIETKKGEYFVEGMHCAACELLIEKKLSKVDGVKKIDAKLKTGKVYIESTKDLNLEELNQLIKTDGYSIVENLEANKAVNKKELITGLLIALVFSAAFILLQEFGVINLASSTGQITFPFVFTIGIVASLSTCMAVVGGLVLTLSSNYAKDSQTKPMIIFHVSRIIGFFVLGGLIGLLGSAFILTPVITFILNLILFVVMVIIAINLLEVIPTAKRFQLRLPKSLGKSVMKIGDSNRIITPVLLGTATFFLPCGFTQSMQIYSLTTGSFINGALTMLVFALGTLPVLALISFASTKFSKGLQSGLFFKTAAFIIILFAIFNFTAALAAIGIISPIFNF